MNYRENYKRLLEELKLLGATEALLKKFSFYSIENEAKVRTQIKSLSNDTSLLENRIISSTNTQKNTNQETIEKPALSHIEPSFIPLAAYPVELHSVYLKKKELFLTACSLKMQLNAVADEDIDKALQLQQQIFNLFEEIDHFAEILDHWTTHKRILKPEPVDYSKLTAIQILQRRNTLRSNIISRRKTLEKLLQNPNPTLTQKDKILKKQEQIKQLEWEVDRLNELIKKN